jgi:hypothetical protein
MRMGIRVCVLAAVSVCASWAQAIAGGGAISGFVLEGDIDGLPQATVTLTNSALGVRRVSTTTDEGAFDILSLPPGEGYRLNVEYKGFSKWESSSFEIAVGQTRVVRIPLQREQAAQAATNVDIESVMAQVEDTKTGVSIVISPAQLASLPSSGERLDPLVMLAPGVSVDASTGRLIFLGSVAANAFLQDDISVSNSYSGTRDGVGGALRLDSTQEFQVLSATYPAEFGRTAGGVVNSVTPSGGNDYHGGAYGYVRSGGWSAAELFSPGQNLLGDRHQEGATIGGPLRRDKLFFFANFERMTDHFEGLNRITTPTLTNASGAIAAQNCTATAAQCNAAIKFIQGQMNVLAPFSQSWTSGLGRIDYRRSEVNSLNVEFNAMNQNSPEAARRQLVAPNGGLLGLQNADEDTRYARLSWTAAPTPGWFSELHAGMYQDRWFDPASTPGLATGNVAITVAGATVGNPYPNSSRLDEKRYQVVENMTWTSGSHSVQLGADVSRTHDDVDSLASAGAYNYPTLTAFAQDFSGGATRSYTNFTQQFGTSAHTVSYPEINAYAQDTWKALPRVSITVGVRWDKTLLPQPSVNAPNYYQTGTIPSSNIAFAPRVSLGYLVNDTTVVRAGFGFFYQPYSGQFIDTLLEGNGLSQTSIVVNPNQTNAPLFPRVLTFTSAPTGTSNLIYAVNKLRNPHTQQASLEVEKQLAHATTVTLSLINSRAIKLWTLSDQNLAAPTKTLIYPIDNAAGAAVGSYSTTVWNVKNDSKYAQIFQVGNGGAAWYNAAALQLRQRMSHGLSLQATYTWSHATGNTTGPLYAGVVPMSSVPGDNNPDKCNLPTDQRQRAVFNWTWQPTVTHSDSPIARFVANGWRFSGIATLASGQPVTPTVLLTGNQTSLFAMPYFNSLNGSGGWDRVPFEQIGSLQTGAQRIVDARLTRTLPFTERVHGEVAAEAFNLFNTQRITGVNTVAYTAVATLSSGLINGPYSGILKPVAGAGLGNASSAFPDGTTARRFQLAFRLIF